MNVDCGNDRFNMLAGYEGHTQSSISDLFELKKRFLIFFHFGEKSIQGKRTARACTS